MGPSRRRGSAPSTLRAARHSYPSAVSTTFSHRHIELSSSTTSTLSGLFILISGLISCSLENSRTASLDPPRNDTQCSHALLEPGTLPCSGPSVSTYSLRPFPVFPAESGSLQWPPKRSDRGCGRRSRRHTRRCIRRDKTFQC